MAAPMTAVPTATEDARAAVRGAGWVAAQRAVHVLEGVIFAITIPRLMGPALFGHYALLVSVSLWFALLSSLGAVSMMTRSVPPMVLRGDHAGLQKLVSGLLALRGLTGLGAAVLYLAVTRAWLGETDWIALGCIAIAVFSRTTANLCFALFLGLNRAGRWGVGEVLRKWLTLVFVASGFATAGLRGACAGFAVANVIVLFVGLWGSRAHIRVRRLWPDFAFLEPFLRTGAAFTAGNLLLSMAQRSGEAVVRLTTGDYVEVAYFGAAYAIYMAGAQAIWSVAVAFAPMLVSLSEQDRRAEVGWWLEQLLAYTSIGTLLALVAAALTGDDLVPLVLGRAYGPVASVLVPLTVALVARAPASLARLQALVADRPGEAAAAAAVELVTFVALGWTLAGRGGAVGGAVAVAAGAMANAAYLSWRLRGTYPFSLRRPTVAALLSMLVLPLALIHGTWLTEMLVLTLAVAVFVALLTASRTVSRADVTAFARRVRTSA